MRLRAILDNLPLILIRGDGDLTVTSITDDSRRVTPGCLFVDRGGRLPGGRTYVLDAVERGAAAVIGVHGIESDWPDHVALATPSDGANIDQALAGRVAEVFFGHPAAKLRLVGITGTNGKTTTAFILQSLLNRLGFKCGLIGTVFTDTGHPAGPEPAELTTPGAIEVHRLFARMVEQSCTAAVMETSSHALHQGRTAGLDFAAGVFTNLTGDHLDYHGTMEAYADAKAILFEQLDSEAWAIVNGGDPASDRMVRDTEARVLRTMVLPLLPPAEGRDEEGCERREPSEPSSNAASVRSNPLSKAEASATIGAMTAAGSEVVFDGPWGSFEVMLPLVGRHNVCNALQAVAVAAALTDAPAKRLREVLRDCPSVPGRLERVALGHASALPHVLVDYAHTHDALRNVLEALRPIVEGRLIVLVGCGGDRDKTKRPKMARVAMELADYVVITSDNPRTEDPETIIADMLVGVGDGGLRAGEDAETNLQSRLHVIVDRAEAIRHAIAIATPADTVLLAGKGHEDYQIIGTTKQHFDDREHAAAALRQWEKDRPTPCQSST